MCSSELARGRKSFMCTVLYLPRASSRLKRGTIVPDFSLAVLADSLFANLTL